MNNAANIHRDYHTLSATLLAIDTATEAYSVALSHRDECMEVFAVAPRQHADQLLPVVDNLLAQAGLAVSQLDGICISRGPGSFTGVRIGIAAAQGLALGADLGLLPVSTLRMLALAGRRQSGQPRVLALLDARMNQVYTAGYDFSVDGGKELLPERVCDPDQLGVAGAVTRDFSQGAWSLAGPGVAAYRQALESALAGRISASTPACYPHARDALTLAQTLNIQPVAAAQIEPAYLRAAVR